MKINYVISIFILFLGLGVSVYASEKQPKKLSQNPKRFSMIPSKAEDVQDTKTQKGRSYSILMKDFFKQKMQQLPLVNYKDPKVVKRFSKPQSDKRCSFWDKEEDLTVEAFDVKAMPIIDSVSDSIALEFDMSKICSGSDSNSKKNLAYQELIKALKQIAPSITIDEGQKALGLLMVKGKDVYNINFKVLPCILAIKKGSEYTKDREALISLITKNLPYIDVELLVNLFIDQGMSFDEIIKKLNKDLTDIQSIYNKIKSEREQEKKEIKTELRPILFKQMKEFLLQEIVGKAEGKLGISTKQEVVEKTLDDLSMSSMSGFSDVEDE
ncbi:MAG: hypothetical protein AB7E68_04870 [Candidatus Babeliales bacterium]